MAMYTYDQFQREAEKAGMLGQFSQADLALAQRYPDAGMSLLQFKRDYGSAQTDEARMLANLGAENIRSQFGNYTAGQYGDGFYSNGMTPGSFQQGEKPTYQGSYSQDLKDLYSQQKNYGSYVDSLPKPEYTNRYDNTIQDLLEQVVNRDPFSYDPETDPSYGAYRKEYAREGQRATADTMAQMAAMTGGMPSSAAVTAAQQAGDYYAAQMADKIPELYQAAYQKYMNDYSMKLSDLDAVRGAEQDDYAKYLDQLGQYNTDRNFDYNAWMDGYNMLANNLQTAQGLEQNEYAKYLDQLSQYNIDREFDYGQLKDTISAQGGVKVSSGSGAGAGSGVKTGEDEGDGSLETQTGLTETGQIVRNRVYAIATRPGLSFDERHSSALQFVEAEKDKGNITDWDMKYILLELEKL